MPFFKLFFRKRNPLDGSSTRNRTVSKDVENGQFLSHNCPLLSPAKRYLLLAAIPEEYTTFLSLTKPWGKWSCKHFYMLVSTQPGKAFFFYPTGMGIRHLILHWKTIIGQIKPDVIISFGFCGELFTSESRGLFLGTHYYPFPQSSYFKPLEQTLSPEISEFCSRSGIALAKIITTPIFLSKKDIFKLMHGMFEKSPAMSCLASARHLSLRSGRRLMRRPLAIARGDSLFYLSCRANARHPIRKPLTSSSNIFEHPQLMQDSLSPSYMEQLKASNIIIDMESALIANLAHQASIPFLSLRATTDAHDKEVPFDVETLLNEEGFVSIKKVISLLVRNPALLFHFLHFWRASRKASENLSATLQNLLSLPSRAFDIKPPQVVSPFFPAPGKVEN